jgi:hypothetical protein
LGFLEADGKKKAGSKWRAVFEGDNLWSGRAGCYPIGDEHVAEKPLDNFQHSTRLIFESRSCTLNSNSENLRTRIKENVFFPALSPPVSTFDAFIICSHQISIKRFYQNPRRNFKTFIEGLASCAVALALFSNEVTSFHLLMTLERCHASLFRSNLD